MRPTTPVKTGLLLCSIQPSVQALSPDLSDCRNKGLRDIGLLNTRWYLSRSEEASIVIVGNHAGKPYRQEERIQSIGLDPLRLHDIATIDGVERTEALDLRESSLRIRRNDMQPNRVWIAVLLVMFFAVSLTITAEGQENG